MIQVLATEYVASLCQDMCQLTGSYKLHAGYITQCVKDCIQQL